MKLSLLIHAASLTILIVANGAGAHAAKPRARDLGISFDGTPGPQNAITDVPGVTVGHTTLIEGESIRTGVTAILPRGKTMSKVPASWFSLNGNGEMTGTTWIDESGFLEGPIAFTNTYSVGVVRDAVRAWGQKHFPVKNPMKDDEAFMLPVVGETWDGVLNDINAFAVKPQHVFAALDSAGSTPTQEGNVGGGTGMMCFEMKCGIGTSSRIVQVAKKSYNVGVLVQANFGDRDELTIAGRKIGALLKTPMPILAAQKKKDGSILAAVATDAPLLPHELKAVAKRVSMGIARTGGVAHQSSGDIFIAFSTRAPETKNATEHWAVIPGDEIDPLYVGTVQATEEAIVNALVAAETLEGHQKRKVFGVSPEDLRMLFKK